MKRLFAGILTILMLFSFAACADLQTDSPDTSKDSQSAGISETETSGTKASGTETSDTQTPGEVTFEELTVVDNEYCTIKITGIEEDSLWGYTLKTYLENKSSDKTFTFSVQAASINGVTVDALFASEVAPGKKANEDLSFTDTDLEENDIGVYSDLCLSFRVYDSDDQLADEVAVSTVHVYPYGESAATQYVRPAKDTDTILVDNEHVTVLVTGYEEDTIWGYEAKLFLVNKTDTTIMVSVDESSVNGYMIDPFFATSVNPETCAFSSISWSDTDLEENNIDTIETIEFSLRVYDSDNWLGDDFVNETITLNP